MVCSPESWRRGLGLARFSADGFFVARRRRFIVGREHSRRGSTWDVGEILLSHLPGWYRSWYDARILKTSESK